MGHLAGSGLSCTQCQLQHRPVFKQVKMQHSSRHLAWALLCRISSSLLLFMLQQQSRCVSTLHRCWSCMYAKMVAARQQEI